VFLDRLGVLSLLNNDCSMELYVGKWSIISLLLISCVSNGFMSTVNVHQDSVHCTIKLQNTYFEMKYTFPFIFSPSK
jgi:hypothetical protein